MANNVVGITFGVEGGKNISGQSGALIKSQLDSLASEIKLKIQIDQVHFENQVNKLKKIIEKNVGTIKVGFDPATLNLGKTKSASGATEKEAVSQEKVNRLFETYAKLRERAARMTTTDMFKKLSAEVSITVANDNLTAAESRLNIKQQEGLKLTERREALEKKILKISLEDTQKKESKLVSSETSYSKLSANAQEWAHNVEDVVSKNKEAADAVKKLQALAEKPFVKKGSVDAQKQQYLELSNMYQKTRELAERNGATQETPFQNLKNVLTNKIFTGLAFLIIGTVTRALKQVYANVVKINASMTQLKIVTGLTATTYERFGNTVATAAKKIGASITDLIDSTTTFARLGYNLDDAAILAEKTSMYSLVAGAEIKEATANITGILKAYGYGAADLEGILDQLIWVGNNYAISSDEIGQGMNNAASALAANGNTLQQSIGILTAANVTLQDVSRSSTAVRTIAARLANSTADLEELGEDTGNILATSVLDKKMREFGVAIVDANGELRSTYDILGDLSEKWGDLSSVQKASIAAMVAGTRQQNAFYSIMQNWGDAETIVKNAADGIGNFSTAQNTYLESTSAKINQLTASWEEFSTAILDSEIINVGVGFLKAVVNLLTKVATVGDGILVLIPAIAIGLVVIQGLVVKIAASAGFVTMWTQLGLLLKIFPSIFLGLKAVYLRIVAIVAARKGSTAAIYSEMQATIALDTAQKSAAASNPIGWIMIAVALVVALVKGLVSLANAHAKAAEAARAAAEEAKQRAEETKEDLETLTELIEKYKDAVAGIDKVEDYDVKTREDILAIQREINKAVGAEAVGLNLVGDNLEENLKKLRTIQREAAAKAAADAKIAYSAAQYANKNADITRVDSDNLKWYDYYIGPGSNNYDVNYTFDKKQSDDEMESLYKLITAADERVFTVGSNLFDSNMSIAFGDEQLSATEKIAIIQKVLKKLEEAGYYGSDLYNQITEALTAWSVYTKELDSTAQNALVATIADLGWGQPDDLLYNIQSVADFEKLRDALIEDTKNNEVLKGLIEEGVFTSENVIDEVDNWLLQWQGDWYGAFLKANSPKFVSSKSFLEIIKEIEGSFDSLSDSLKSLSENGIVASGAITKLLEEYPELEKYFQQTEQGYILGDDYTGWTDGEVLNDYIRNYLQKYVDAVEECRVKTEQFADGEEGAEAAANALAIAQDNLNNAIAAGATLLRSQQIEEETKKLEEQKEAYEESLDKQKDLLDIRKDLLKTYKEELDYQRELAAKQKTVADLQTRLALVKMDNSASGRAQARELQEQLSQAQETLDDFTLEHAIDVLTAQIDAEYTEYETFIDREIDRIEEAIKNLAKDLNVVVAVPAPTEVAEVPEHHVGGFVGNMPVLKSNEEFAKLLRGEFVVTPTQMTQFMNSTLPAMVGGNSGGINYNAPLIEIFCESITEDSMPEMKKAVDAAVAAIKNEIDSGFSRTGYRKSINKFAT